MKALRLAIFAAVHGFYVGAFPLVADAGCSRAFRRALQRRGTV